VVRNIFRIGVGTMGHRYTALIRLHQVDAVIAYGEAGDEAKLRHDVEQCWRQREFSGPNNCPGITASAFALVFPKRPGVIEWPQNW
jgi:hypothetical protein